MKKGLWVLRQVSGGMGINFDMTCASRKQGTAGVNDLLDCNFPFCACDVPAYHELKRIVPIGDKCKNCPKSDDNGTNVFCYLLQDIMPDGIKKCGINE